jgi:hypothetical protein
LDKEIKHWDVRINFFHPKELVSPEF